MILHHGFVDGLKNQGVSFVKYTLMKDWHSLIASGNCVVLTFTKAWQSYLHQEVKHTGVQGFGESVSSVARLLHVQCHINGLHRTSPLAVHLPARQFLLQAVLVNPEQERRKGQNCENAEKKRERGVLSSTIKAKHQTL